MNLYGIEFCPRCKSRLTTVRKEKGSKAVLFFSCRRCKYEKRVVNSTKIASRMNHFSKEGVVVVGEKEQELRTLPTARVECSARAQQSRRTFNAVLQMHKMQLHFQRGQLMALASTQKGK